MKRIAFFDFDGTITTEDSLPAFIKFHSGRRKYYFGVLLNSPFIVAYKLGILSNHAAKQRLFRYFFRNASLNEFQTVADTFAETVVPGMVRNKALAEIRKLQALGFEVVIVSASASNWIRHWSSSVDAALVATDLEVADGRLTGNIKGLNCHGLEKVKRIQEAYDVSGYDEIYGYGDTKGDKPMLSLATFGFYQPFR